MKYNQLLILILFILSLFNSVSAIWIYPDVELVAGDFSLFQKSAQNYSVVGGGNDYILLNSHNITFAKNCSANKELIEVNGNFNLGHYTVYVTVDVYAPTGWTVNTVYMKFYTNNSLMTKNQTVSSSTVVNSTFRRFYYNYNPSNTLTDVDMGNFSVDVFVAAENSTIRYKGNKTFYDVFEVYEIDPPYAGNSDYIENLNRVNFTYTAGNNTDSLVVVRRNDTYPTGPADTNAYIVQNATVNGSDFFNDSNVLSTRYYSVYGWNATTKSWSQPLELIWGAFAASVFNESNSDQAITNWSIQITNMVTEEVYNASNQNNIMWLDVLDVPNGEDISIRIWADDYYESDWVIDLYNNVLYNLTFYLPALYIPSGGDPGGGSGEDPNQTFSPELYYIRVEDDYYNPVEDAKVEVKRFIDGSFESVGSFLSDANGYGDMLLIPNVEYKVNISKEGYANESSLWRPDPIYYGIYNPKVFRIVVTDPSVLTIFGDIEWSIEPIGYDMFSNFTMYFNITSSDSQLEWFLAKVMLWNVTSEEWEDLSYYINYNDTGGGSINYTTTQLGKYGFQCVFKKENYNEFTFGSPHSENKYVFILWPVGSTGNPDLDTLITATTGDSPVFMGTVVVAYTSLIAAAVITVLLFTFSAKFAGFGIMILGFVLGAFKQPLNLISDDVINFSVVAIIIILGFLTLLIYKKRD